MGFRSRRASRELLDLSDQHARGTSGYTGSGRDVPGHDRSGAHDGALANRYTAQNRRPTSQAGSAPHDRFQDFPINF